MVGTLYDRIGGRVERLREILSKGVPDDVMKRACGENVWFTRQGVDYALDAIVRYMLDPDTVRRWLTGYDDFTNSGCTAVIMAGNIPMAGFFDLLCCAIVGGRTLVKRSRKDDALMSWIEETIRTTFDVEIDSLTDSGRPDAVIASGGDAAAALFRERYGDKRLLLRGHRISAAVITGDESRDEMSSLCEDIFTHFTLGCRNVTHLYLPVTVDVASFARKAGESMEAVTHTPFVNNYRQLKAVKAMEGLPFCDGGFFLLTEGFDSSETGELTYSLYDTPESLGRQLERDADRLQCLVRRNGDGMTTDCGVPCVSFGRAQRPYPWEYPDGRDIMEFLRGE